VVASAVAVNLDMLSLTYDADSPLGYITDSKKVTPKRRQAIYTVIQEQKLAITSTYSVPASIIDSINILEATKLAWQQVVEGCLNQLPLEARVCVIIDGNTAYRDDLFDIRPVIKGDAIYWSIALASILAKVSRDSWMVEQSQRYPEYELGQHKGYGTRRHIEAIRNHGLTPMHRKTFCKNFL
jgi:ribonuclease HII